jgi:hypothetical protein
MSYSVVEELHILAVVAHDQRYVYSFMSLQLKGKLETTVKKLVLCLVFHMWDQVNCLPKCIVYQ